MQSPALKSENRVIQCRTHGNKSNISILWGIFTIIFGLLFLLLLSQLEVQTFREDLKIWRDLSLIIILSGTIYSLILITKGMLSWEKNKT